MTLTLAVDTAGDYGSLALADETGTREEVLLHEPRGFSQILFGEIEALMLRQHVALKDIDLFAAASGPGSFTGVRVGLAAVKGLAEVLHHRVVAVSNLEAVATFGTLPRRAAVIDARRGEFYTALYGDEPIPETVLPFEKFLDRLPEGPVEWVSPDLTTLAPLLAGTRFEAMPRIEAPKALAAAIARIAMASKSSDPAAIEANYVRRSDAEIFWKEM